MLPDLGYPIFPNQTRDDFSATLMPELKENPPGLYRVRKTVITGQGAGIVHYPLAATFYLSDNPEDYEEYTRFASRLHEPRPMAEFKGGREAMTRFFEQNLRYPESYKGTGTKVRLLLLHDRFLRNVTESHKPTREYTVSSRYGENL